MNQTIKNGKNQKEERELSSIC